MTLLLWDSCCRCATGIQPVGSPSKINQTSGPQAPLPVKGIGAQPASLHTITMLVWLGKHSVGKSLGEDTGLATQLGSSKRQRPQPPSCGQMWLGHLTAQKLGYLRPRHSLRFMHLGDLIWVISHSFSWQVSSGTAGAPLFSGCWC